MTHITYTFVLSVFSGVSKNSAIYLCLEGGVRLSFPAHDDFPQILEHWPIHPEDFLMVEFVAAVISGLYYC